MIEIIGLLAVMGLVFAGVYWLIRREIKILSHDVRETVMDLWHDDTSAPPSTEYHYGYNQALRDAVAAIEGKVKE